MATGTVKWFNDAKGVWLYQPGRRWGRPVCALLRNQGRGVQVAARKPESELRGEDGSEGQASLEYQTCLITKVVGAGHSRRRWLAYGRSRLALKCLSTTSGYVDEPV